MSTFSQWVNTLSGILWGDFLWIVILGTGLFLSVRIGFKSISKIPYAFGLLWKGRHSNEPGTISPFSALMVSLSATVGTGNIVGVATAIGIGGPGALFWMWVSALLGMATKYAEAVCAIQYREKNEKGEFVGGPMYYIKNGLPKAYLPLGFAFAIFAALAGFGIGNAVQANSIASAIQESFGVPPVWVSLILTVLVAAVLLGGIKSISATARKLVPIMASIYILAGLVVIGAHISEVPAALATIVKTAFTGTAAQGGFAGAVIALAIEKGIARGVFSNEAGLGSAPIAHAAAQTSSPVRQGCIAMLGTFIDTLVICSITGLAIVVSGAWFQGEQGVVITQWAYMSVLPFGDMLVAVSLSLFAFTTILGWSYYGERSAEFIFGAKIQWPYRVAWVLMVPVGVLAGLDVVWAVADVLNGLMAIPNLIALILLSGVIASLTKKYFSDTNTTDT